MNNPLTMFMLDMCRTTEPQLNVSDLFVSIYLYILRQILNSTELPQGLNLKTSASTHYFSQGAVWGFNTEHTNDHIRLTKIVHSQQ